MKPLKIIFLSVVAALNISLLISTSVLADFEAGINANRNGDRATAFQEFQAAAMDRDERAYGKLASMYLYGLGTQKDFVKAYVWFHMAHLAGEKEAERFRETATSMLTREDLSKAVAAAEQQRIELDLKKR